MIRRHPSRRAPGRRAAGPLLAGIVAGLAVAGLSPGPGMADEAGVPGGTAPAPTWRENFAGSRLDPAWTVRAAEGNDVSAEKGTLKITCRAGTVARAERVLSVDGVQISCGMITRAGRATSWLIAWWSPENYCQLGVTTAGRLVACEVVGTYPHEVDLGPWEADRWHGIAVELGHDCIRYLAGEDGRSLKPLHVSRRAARLAGPVKRLVLGEGPESKVFPPASPFITSSPPGTPGTCHFRSLRVEALPAERVRASDEERRAFARGELDTLAGQELSTADDPTLDSVSRHLPPLKWSREVVGVQDHPHEIGVAADGSLQFADDIANYRKPVAFFEIGEPAYRFGSDADGCGKRLLDGYLPIVVARDTHDGLELEQTIFGWSRDASPEEPLFASVRMRVTNGGGTARTAKLRLVVEPSSATTASPEWMLQLPARGSASVCVRVPYAIQELPAAEITAPEFDRGLRESSDYWRRIVAAGSRFEIPEPAVQDAYRAWIAYNFLNVARRGGTDHVCDGSGFYGQVYGYSAALYCNALDLIGCHEASRRYLDSLLTFVQPSGLLAVNFGDTDTGAALWVMAEHYRMTADAGWLRRVAPKMQAMCGWIVRERSKALAAAADQPVTARGLIRFRPYADHVHPAADYFSNGYLWRGLVAAASVFAEIGMADEAARLQQAGDAYLADLTRSMDEAVFTDGDMRILPAIPDTRELWKESDDSANGYYSLIASCMLEAGVPAARDPRADLIVQALERRGGLVLGLCRFHDMADHAYAYGYWMNCLERDDVRRAILGLYGSMAYGMSRGTYAAVECTFIRTGENFWTLPHTYSNTQQLRLLRHMLLRECGDDLLIAQAVPRPWLAAGKRLIIRDAPTRFGPVTCSIEAAENGSRVHLVPPARPGGGAGAAGPRAIRIRLRQPGARDIRSVSSEPRMELSFQADTIELPRPDRPVELRVEY